MSKHSLIIIVIFVILSSALYSQRFQGAVMAGMNISQVDGDEVFGYHRVGGHFGLAAILPVKEKWDLTLETVFNQKGAYQKPQYKDSVFGTVLNGQYDLHLDYVEIPFMAHYTDRFRYSVGAGFSYGRLVYSKEVEHNGAIPPYSDTVAFNKNDWDVLVDLQIRVWKRLKFNARYSYSMAAIRERVFIDPWEQKDPESRKQYNNMLTFRVVYVFNENLDKLTPNDNQ